jgi:ABC-type antimicrobial peptide transport system permease subunit
VIPPHWPSSAGGGIGLLEAALVVAAAFAVSLRRRQHEIGLLGSVGAAPGTIGAALLVSTGALAAAGALAGAVVGIGAAAALHPFLDAWNRRANGGFEVAWAYVVGGVLLAA